MDKRRNGFTLIEIIVVVAIIAILAALGIPSVQNVIDESQISADLATLSMLNKMSVAYGVTNGIRNEDVFYGYDSDPNRLTRLVDTGYFESLPKAQVNGEEFNWSIDDQVWYYSKYVSNIGNMTEIIFDENFNIHDYINTFPDRWHATENGLEGDYGLLFIPNNRDEYSITTLAALEEGTGRGYGILFETAVGEEGTDDTGYCLQFDRGLDGVAIRPRINGNELGPEVVVRNNLNSLIPSDRADEWWAEQHEVQMDVSRVDDGTKTITVSIDGVVVIEDHEFESEITADMNNTGFRVWGDTTQYESIKIE